MSDRILIIKLGAFGDVVLADGAIKDIRRHHPDAEITVLTAKPYDRILGRHPAIDHVLIDPRKPRWHLAAMGRLKRALTHQPFTRVYDLQDRRRTQGYYQWLKPVEWSGSVLGCSHPMRKESHAIADVLDRQAAQLVDAGVTIQDTLSPKLDWLFEPIDNVLKAQGIPERFVLLIPGCSAKHPHKRWPNYGELATHLAAQGLTCVTAPGPDEKELCASLPATALCNADGKPLTFGQVGHLASRALFVVGNDTGPTHLSAWSGSQGLALFGPHAPSENTGIARVWSTIDVDDLAQLSVERVAQTVLDQIE